VLYVNFDMMFCSGQKFLFKIGEFVIRTENVKSLVYICIYFIFAVIFHFVFYFSCRYLFVLSHFIYNIINSPLCDDDDDAVQHEIFLCV
jgi:hypothetical protein